MSNNKNKIFTFWSPNGGDGATLLSVQTAKILAQKNLKTLIVEYDLKQPSIARSFGLNPSSMHTLDTLIPYTNNGTIPQATFDGHVKKIEDNLYLLRGLENTIQSNFIENESLEIILTTAQENFDCIIVNVNAIIDNAGTLIGLLKADKVFLITQKDVNSIYKFDYSKGIIRDSNLFDWDKFEIVITKDNKNVYMGKEDVEKYFEKTFSYSIASLGVDYLNANNAGKGNEYFKTHKKAKPFLDSLNAFVNMAILNTDKGKKKNSLFSK